MLELCIYLNIFTTSLLIDFQLRSLWNLLLLHHSQCLGTLPGKVPLQDHLVEIPLPDAADVDVAFPVEDSPLGESCSPDNFVTKILIFRVKETQ